MRPLVHINQVGLSNFKSFGGTISIPLEPGFTVVTGPNGSGKSNILDGVLFCLGLASSRGMRADRLPDLVNSSLLRAGKSAETTVSVTFDLNDWEPDAAEKGLEPPAEGPWIKPTQKEWTVTRRLRVMPGGSYSSSYSADGETCTLQQLQTQFRRLRIDPEGSNVVMQGDVTRIVSMSNKDRRGLIDELAGVALFDTRIEQTRSKLNDVHDRQDRCRIVEQELYTSKNKLEKDCAKARTYQELKTQLQVGREHELVLSYKATEEKLESLKNEHHQLGQKEIIDSRNIHESEKTLAESCNKLNKLQDQVKALGEDKLIAVQAEIAGLDTQSRELERQASLHRQEGEKLQENRNSLTKKRNELQMEIKEQEEISNTEKLITAEKNVKDALAAVEVWRRRLGDAAGRSEKWIDEQKERSTQRQNLHSIISPLQQEEEKIKERLLHNELRKRELEIEQKRDNEDNQQLNLQLDALEEESEKITAKINEAKEGIKESTEKLSIQQRTRIRLEQEQTRIEKEITKIDSRRETLQESRGAGALKLLLEAGLDGIHGPVAQLGEVEDSYRLALEVAAGSRLGHLVVDNEEIAAKAIEILKAKKAGRLTFLPLNRINPSNALKNQALARFQSEKEISNYSSPIGKAIELIKFEPIYNNVFSYVFGDTLVFKDLRSARKFIGKNRAVTLEGELLEKTGAMTGGSFSKRSNLLGFSRATDQDEAEPLRRRLIEIGEALISSHNKESIYTKSLNNLRPILNKLEQRQAGLEAEKIAVAKSNGPLLKRRNDRSNRLKDLIIHKQEADDQLNHISSDLHPLLIELEKLEALDSEMQKGSNSENWNKLQGELKSADSTLEKAAKIRDNLIDQQRQKELLLQRIGDQKEVLAAEEEQLKESVKSLSEAHKNWRINQEGLQKRKNFLNEEQKKLQILFGEQRHARDAAEADVAKQRQEIQQSKWNLDRLKEKQESLTEELRNESLRLQEFSKKLPDPIPAIPVEILNAGLEALQINLEQIQTRMEELEPVNMLALEELEELENRLKDLVEKLSVLTEERSELLLRIETVATLRQEAFMEAFNAVDKHFREIFANLSDGDGHLQLENNDEPLEGGLTLVAHPKGKTVRRLAAMSGGEKSLTALSFLFALQRFRPSPFYALDEVDSFLDGINVERLSGLISRQAFEAQFLVVSHRRPMISASTRTIGVTQARGAHTQVIGLPDAA